ncbi:hypothetical protein V7O62_04170 [Methanolobus sp. ZRKC2]|uniref:hypothetical protein n=1 Tax=Methanolobus sp. ZRKC2 TaxID=3125783 RepID=UPI0032491EA2
MKISKRSSGLILGLIILYNILIRFQVELYEIGYDSFFVHVLINSISEFGYAKWCLSTLSFAGLYPYSYASSVPFLLSGFSQISNIHMNYVIFIYCQIIGLLSIFVGYLMASKVTDNDFIKLISALFFSVSLSIVDYSTMTIPTRGLLIVLAPLSYYMLVKIHETSKFSYYVLFVSLSLFLFVTHHLFYFLIPLFLSYVILFFLPKFKICKLFPEKYRPLMILIGFSIMFSIPFFTGKFVEDSRYAPLFTNYLRYMGIPLIYAIGGLLYLTFKTNKTYSEYLLIMTTVFITVFIYNLTYLKMFIPVFLVPFAGYGFYNFVKSVHSSKNAKLFIILSLLVITSFVSYFQFLHNNDNNDFIEHNLEQSTFVAGNWMKENTIGNAISNNNHLGFRLAAIAETTHFLTLSSVMDQIYGFIIPDISEFERYPLTSEDFWYSGYSGPDHGNAIWADLHRLKLSPTNYSINYVVEDVDLDTYVLWNHRPFASKLIVSAHNDKACVFDDGDIKIWM